MTSEPPLFVLAAAVSLAALFTAIDAKDPAFRASWSSDRRRRQRNVAYLVANLVTMAALNAVTHALVPTVPSLAAPLWQRSGLLVEVLVCLLVAELVNWLAHAVKHHHPWLWRFHLQHHVETHYSVNLTLHTHGLEVVFTGACMAALLALCGFSAFAVDVFTVVYFGANLYKHSSARLSLGPLDRLIVSPAYHRLHHSRDHEGNYGSVLTVFDVIMGTAHFPRPAERVFEQPLGVRGDAPFGFLDEMLAPFANNRPAPAPLLASQPIPLDGQAPKSQPGRSSRPSSRGVTKRRR